jgi:hypothetical protein
MSGRGCSGRGTPAFCAPTPAAHNNIIISIAASVDVRRRELDIRFFSKIPPLWIRV